MRSQNTLCVDVSFKYQNKRQTTTSGHNHARFSSSEMFLVLDLQHEHGSRRKAHKNHMMSSLRLLHKRKQVDAKLNLYQSNCSLRGQIRQLQVLL